jgi:hypothetical protein
MLSLPNQISNVSYRFTKNLLSEISSRRKSVIDAENDFDESIEIDEWQVDKTYLTLYADYL